MRQYEIRIPGRPVRIRANLRSARNLPPGTRIFMLTTDRWGVIKSRQEIPVIDGRPAIRKHVKRMTKS